MRVREAVFALLTPAVVGTLQARVWPVPGPGTPTIQLGLDSAGTNDTVLVAPSVYPETLNWPSRSGIKLLSELGPDATTIDADGLRRVINFPQYLGQTTIIDGFTITGGWARPPNSNAAGLNCAQTAPLVRGNTIEANDASGAGGGVYCTGSSSGAHLVGNAIKDNSANIGGGASWYQCGTGVIRENFFHNISAGRGGAIDCEVLSHPDIRRNRFLINRDPSGCIRCGWSNPGNYQSMPRTNWNSLVHNRDYEVGSDNGYDYHQVPATRNWWGTSGSPVARTRGYVTYSPWLHSPLIFDISAESITNPPDTVAPESCCVPRVVVRNRGYCDSFPDPDSVDVTFFTATCVICDYRKYVRVDRSVHQDSATEVSFPAWAAPQSGVCTMRVWLHYAPDMDSANDTISKLIVVQGVGVEEDGARLARGELRVWPNPSGRTTNLVFMMPSAGIARVEVCNSSGKRVAVLAERTLDAGRHDLRWTGLDDRGRKVPSGIYFCRLQTGEFTATRKMVKAE